MSRSMSVYEACLAIGLHSLFQVQRNRCVIKLIIQWKIIACIYLLERVIKWVRLYLFISLSICTKPCLLKCYIYFVYSQKCFFAENILCFHRKLSLICKVRYLLQNEYFVCVVLLCVFAFCFPCTIFTFSCLYEGSCLIYVCLCIVVFNTYFVVICFSSSCVPYYVASFSGLSIFDCPFGFL